VRDGYWMRCHGGTDGRCLEAGRISGLLFFAASTGYRELDVNAITSIPHFISEDTSPHDTFAIRDDACPASDERKKVGGRPEVETNFASTSQHRTLPHSPLPVALTRRSETAQTIVQQLSYMTCA
jgi:hypothetical protein